MHRIDQSAVVLASVLFLQLTFAQLAYPASEVHAPMNADLVRTQVLTSLSDRQLPADARRKIDALWISVDASTSADLLLDLVIQSFALADSEVMDLIQQCNSPEAPPARSRADALNRPTYSAFFRANGNLYYGRYLVEKRLYDEAWDILKSVDTRQVVDPASLFFFQAVAAQGLLELKPALNALQELLTNTERVPVRYSAAANLMQAELKGVEEKSLGEISRLMADSERRLDLGRAGEKVQGVQERIISTLDEIIKKIEQQQGGGGGGGGEGGSSNNPSGGAEDSSVKGAEAPGEVDKKQFDNKGTWGNLPEKDLAKAKNDLNKNFPSHYEQAIEKYTKKLATRSAKKK